MGEKVVASSCRTLFLSGIVLFVLISFPLVNSVGASSEMWSQTYGGTDDDSAEVMIQTSDGGFALAGYTWSFGAGGYDFWLVKTDANGSMEWSKTYGGAGIDYAYSLVETSDGGYALAGETNSFGAGRALAGETNSFDDGPYDFWLVKTDKFGNVEWNQTYGGANSERAYSLVETSDGGYALAGCTTRFGIMYLPYSDFWLVKTDMNGKMEWNQTYDDGIARSLVETSGGGFALAGGSRLVKTDAYGNMEWNQTYNGSVQSLVEASDGGFALAGSTRSFGAGLSDFWLVRTNPVVTTEPFPITWIAASIAIIAVVGAALLVYFVKVKKTTGKGEKITPEGVT